MSFVKIGKLLPKAAALSEESRAMEAAYVVEVVNGKIAEIFGEKAVGNVKAVKYKNGILNLGVVNNVWGQEIRYKEQALKKFIQDNLRETVFRKISYTLVGTIS